MLGSYETITNWSIILFIHYKTEVFGYRCHTYVRRNFFITLEIIPENKIVYVYHAYVG